jgi:hypothetical protein
MGFGLGCLIAVTVCSALPEKDRGQPPRVKNNTFISRDNPKMRVSVDSKFQYIGNVSFTIDNVAGGNRYVFVRTTP